MVIRKQKFVVTMENYVATMENYVATLIKKLLKKNVVILFCYIATMIKQMAVEFVSTIKFMSRHKKTTE